MVDHFIRKKTRRQPRSCCRFVKNQGWWETVRDMHDNNKFYETFPLSCTLFYHILNKISDEIEKKKKCGVRSTSSSRLHTCCNNLQTHCRGDYIYTIGEMCGLARATVCTIISENCVVIIKNTLPLCGLGLHPQSVFLLLYF